MVLAYEMRRPKPKKKLIFQSFFKDKLTRCMDLGSNKSQGKLMKCMDLGSSKGITLIILSKQQQSASAMQLH